LGMLLVPLDGDYGIPLRRAPDVREACAEAYGPAEGTSVTSLRSLLGLIGAHEWRTKGLEIAAIGGRIHPHYGVFAPIRSEYVDLVATAPLPDFRSLSGLAFDIGTGTGVLAAVLARRGIRRVVATDRDPRALACARENLERLMLRGFLSALPAHLEPRGEGWVVLSDLAEHLGLRPRSELLAAFEAAGLKVLDRSDARPKHPRAFDETDPLHAARAAEVTSLWRLAVR